MSRLTTQRAGRDPEFNWSGYKYRESSGGGVQRDTSDPKIIQHHIHFTPNSGCTGIINLSEIKYIGNTGNNKK